MRLFSDMTGTTGLLLSTYQDAGAVRGPAVANEAVATAYRKIATVLPWSYLHRRYQIVTQPMQNTGSIAYNSTTNILTLTGGTWPSWVIQGQIVIGSAVYAVQNLLSSTTISLVPGRAPTADVTAGTAYTLFQSEYVLPADFMRMEDLVIIGNAWRTWEVDPGSFLQIQRIFYNPSRPWQFLTRGSTFFPGRMAVEFSPAPDIKYIYDISYFAKPRPRTLGAAYSTGTVSVSGTSVTGVGTTFTQSMVGCVLRQGTTGAVPVGEFSPNGSFYDNVIQSVQSATALTLVDAGNAASAVKFLIDDPVDIERTAMDEVFCRMCEYEFAILTRSNGIPLKRQLMVTALMEARAADVRKALRQYDSISPSWQEVAYANMVH